MLVGHSLRGRAATNARSWWWDERDHAMIGQFRAACGIQAEEMQGSEFDPNSATACRTCTRVLAKLHRQEEARASRLKTIRPITRRRLVDLCQNWEVSGATNNDELDALLRDAQHYQRLAKRAEECCLPKSKTIYDDNIEHWCRRHKRGV